MLMLNFNSRPHEEVDSLIQNGSSVTIVISTHDLTRRSTRYKMDFKLLVTTFQLTTSRGGRPESLASKIGKLKISTHDLTRRSTSFAGQWRRWQTNFNSRPHEEVDYWMMVKFFHTFISTHDLTRRSTYCWYTLCYTNTFQLTTSRGGRLLYSGVGFSEGNFNSRPHEEVDGLYRNDLIVGRYISTHDLTRRSTLMTITPFSNASTFQLTTSRGGRRSFALPNPSNKPFQLTTSRGGRH